MEHFVKKHFFLAATHGFVCALIATPLSPCGRHRKFRRRRETKVEFRSRGLCSSVTKPDCVRHVVGSAHTATSEGRAACPAPPNGSPARVMAPLGGRRRGSSSASGFCHLGSRLFGSIPF